MDKLIRKIIEQMKIDLAWRGPGGHPLGHVVLPRHEAQAIVDWLEESALLLPIGTWGSPSEPPGGVSLS